MSISTDTMTPEPVLLRHDEDGIATLTLNRPDKYNAPSEELANSLQSGLDQIAGSVTPRVVIIAANGKAIRAGHDFFEQLPAEPADDYAYAREGMACNTDSHDAREGILAFMDKRKPEWKYE